MKICPSRNIFLSSGHFIIIINYLVIATKEWLRIWKRVELSECKNMQKRDFWSILGWADTVKLEPICWFLLAIFFNHGINYLLCDTQNSRDLKELCDLPLENVAFYINQTRLFWNDDAKGVQNWGEKLIYHHATTERRMKKCCRIYKFLIIISSRIIIRGFAWGCALNFVNIRYKLNSLANANHTSYYDCSFGGNEPVVELAVKMRGINSYHKPRWKPKIDCKNRHLKIIVFTSCPSSTSFQSFYIYIYWNYINTNIW